MNTRAAPEQDPNGPTTSSQSPAPAAAPNEATSKTCELLPLTRAEVMNSILAIDNFILPHDRDLRDALRDIGNQALAALELDRMVAEKDAKIANLRSDLDHKIDSHIHSCRVLREHAEQRDRQMVEKDAELKQWRTWNIVEIAVRNEQVAQYVTHWENRAEKAEAELAEAKTNADKWFKACLTLEGELAELKAGVK